MKTYFWTVASLIGLAGCTEGPPQSPLAASKVPVPVETYTVKAIALPSIYEATGTVHARTTVSIASKLTAYVLQVSVQAGDRVKNGQLLIQLETHDLDARTQRAQAAHVEVKSALAEIEGNIASAKASLDLAKTTFNRMQELYNKRSISNQEFDETSARLKSAQAAYEMAQAKRAQLDARVDLAEREVNAAQVNAGYAEIAAPFDGIVSSKAVEPGNLAVAGSTLLTIERDGGYRLEALVDESRLGSIRIGQHAQVKIEGGSRTLSGTVAEILPEVDASARAGTVKIDLPAVAELRSGVFARALFNTGSRQAVTVPAAAMLHQGQLQSVLVAENGVARTRMVTLGVSDGDNIEVLSGLNEGESVILPVPQGVTDGTQVEMRR